MKDFNSYANEAQGNSGGRKDGYGVDVTALLKSLAGKYEGADENEMIAAILDEAEKGRKNGTLTDADLENFERTVSPMLNETQRRKLRKIIHHLMKK